MNRPTMCVAVLMLGGAAIESSAVPSLGSPNFVCTRKGANVSGIGCLIAASVIAGGHELLTVDADFQAIGMSSALKLFGEHQPV